MAKNEERKSFWKKVLEGFLALGGLFGLLSITNVIIPLNWWLVVLISVFLIILIFHLKGKYDETINYFKGIKKDIKYIKSKTKDSKGRKI